MKLYADVLTSASSGVYNWSNALPVYRYAKNGYFNLMWTIHTSATTLNFVWSGSTSAVGTFVSSGSSVIIAGVTSGSAPDTGGTDFEAFSPDLFPFVKIGSYACGTTSTINAHLMVD